MNNHREDGLDQLRADAAYLREKGRQLGYDQGGDKLIEAAAAGGKTY